MLRVRSYLIAAGCVSVLQVEALQEFMEMLGSDPARAFYGPGHVFAANELGEQATLAPSPPTLLVVNQHVVD